MSQKTDDFLNRLSFLLLVVFAEMFRTKLLLLKTNSQLSFTYWKLAIETLKQGVKYVQNLQQRHQNDANGVILMSLFLTLNKPAELLLVSRNLSSIQETVML